MRWKPILYVGSGLLGTLTLAGGYLGYKIWATDGCACGLAERKPLSVYNPFRDRGPEKVVNTYLAALKNGDCHKLPPDVFASREAQVGCPKRYPLRAWTLRARESKGDEVDLYYGVAWKDMAGLDEPLDISLVRKNGSWQIATVDTFY